MLFSFLVLQLKESKGSTKLFLRKIMTFKYKLSQLKVAIDGQLEKYFDSAIRDAKGKDKLLAEALDQIKKIALSGGKRVRGALLCQSYFGFGGKDRIKIIKAAAAIELVHLFLLVHDDIIDRGNVRHGKMTLNAWFAKKYEKKLGKEEAKHLAISMAIIAGDLLYAMAIEIISKAGFEEKNSVAAISQLQKVVANTIVGQSQDINISYDSKISQEKILKMYENKTAKYTFEGPLQIGALLAGENDKKMFQKISNFSVPLGIAFQIQDDMLGIFGNEKHVGKSASDIEEGKRTLLVAKAYEFANDDQIKQINAILGKKNLSKSEIEKFQNLLIETGSFDYNKKMADQYFETGKKEIEKNMMLAEPKKFLFGMIEYLEKREI